MILKEYQKRTLATVQGFLEALATWREKDRAARSQDPEWGFDWVERAWSRTVAGRPYHPRRNGLGERLPAFCLKIPTGGGKTLLATRVIDLFNAHYRQSRRGLVLWIVPTTQIYNQTLKALKDRDHPYRQQLDLSSGQRTRIFEKTTAFGPRDVAENLCILLLMLPSANRKTKDTLRMFRDSGASTGSSPRTTIPPPTPNCWRNTPIWTPSTRPRASGAVTSRLPWATQFGCCGR
ncbi:MAG: DEAD/DEAH box helicase family protein [Acidobacteriota bacterium]|nr:DEAD/DEAH box helicase family protein [Acidobacteriota bacterium]